MKRKITGIIIIVGISIITIFIFQFNSEDASNSIPQKVENIELDIDKTIDIFDFSSIVDTSILIVPLENSEESLIGEITDIIFKDNRIFIIDNTTKTVFIFDLQGNLLSKICKIGRGPDEYLGITACTVLDSTVIIYDHITRNLNRYNAEGKFLERISFTGWGSSLFSIGKKLYFINNWSSSDEGCYRLFSLDLSNQHLEKYIPFPQQDTRRGWGIDRHYAQYKDTTLLFYSSCDTIYKVTDNGISASHYVNFVKKKLPEQKATGNGSEALLACMKGDYIQGIKTLNQSENLIFIQYKDKSHSYTSIYDKNSKNVVTCRYMTLNQNGKINLAKFKIDQNMILSYTFASDFKLLYEYTYSKAQYSDVALKQKIELLNQSIKEDSNPILFIYKIKSSAHI